jgi:hypothetical protein
VAATVVVGGSVHAQPLPPFQVTVTVSLAGCPANATGNLQTLSGTLPAQDIDFAFWQGGSGSCSASLDLLMDSFSGSFVVTVPCSGVVLTDTVDYQINTLGGDSAHVLVWLDCGAPPAQDCLGVPGGSAQPGTPCVTVGGAPGAWNEECQCVFSSGNCNACFTVSQALDGNGDPIPFTAAFSNCSSGGTAPITYVWDFPSTAQTAFETTYTYSGAGTWFACLNMNAAGCTSNLCDTVVFDMNGMLVDSVVVYDCLQIANGPNLPGTPCTNPATGETGTWSADCECITNSTGCQAGFWVIQAYDQDSLPVPNEVWVWNLSSGTSPFQFLWTFGDGTSSTEAFPTHVYANGGPYQLCLTITDGAGCTSVHCDDVSVDDSGFYSGMVIDGRPGSLRSGFTIRVRDQVSTDVSEEVGMIDAMTWPNPVSDQLNLNFRSTAKGAFVLQVADVNGRVLRSTRAGFAYGDNRIQVSTEGLPAGLYLLRMEQGGNVRSIRFVKD